MAKTKLRNNPTIYKMSETEFREQVIELCKWLKWKYYFSWSSIHSPNGYPDLCLVKELANGTAKLVYFELKSETGKLTKSQKEWLSILGKVPNVIAKCIRPSDWDDIVKILE